MKKIIKLILSFLFVILVSLSSVYADEPPDPGGGPGSGDLPVGGGAPVGSGLIILISLAGGYAIRKIHTPARNR